MFYDYIGVSSSGTTTFYYISQASVSISTKLPHQDKIVFFTQRLRVELKNHNKNASVPLSKMSYESSTLMTFKIMNGVASNY